MSWTDERVETLKRMWAEGLSASQIAKDLGGVTRNAVIGKVHRLGLSNRVEGEEAAAAAPVAPAPEPAPETWRLAAFGLRPVGRLIVPVTALERLDELLRAAPRQAGAALAQGAV